MRIGWVVVVQVLVLSGDLLVAKAGPGLDPKIARNLEVRWASVRYSRSAALENPEIANTPEEKSESLVLSCQVKIRDPNVILGTNEQVVITQLTDSKGRNAVVTSTASSSDQMYRGPRYERKFRRPDPMPKWRALVWKILRRPPPVPAPPQLVSELQPSEMGTRLDMELLARAGGELRTVKGYFYAIVAGSIEYVEVPFESNDRWVRLTPDVEIRVQEAVCENDGFRYRIVQRPQGGRHARPLMVGQKVPARLVVAEQFIGEDGKAIGPSTGSTMLPIPVAASGVAGGTSGKVKTIRFVIAVDAKECKIPFELQHIPLPKP